MYLYRKITAVIREGGLGLLAKKVWKRLSYRYNTDLFYHTMPQGLPNEKLELIVVKPEQNDKYIAERILKAYNKAVFDGKESRYSKSYKDAWDDNREVYHNDLLKILAANDPERLFSYLSSMHAQKSVYGVSGNATEYKRLLRSVSLRKKEAGMIKDILVALAEALGILPYEDIVPATKKKNHNSESQKLSYNII